MLQGNTSDFRLALIKVLDLRRDIAALVAHSQVRFGGAGSDSDPPGRNFAELFRPVAGRDGRASFVGRDEFRALHGELYQDLLTAFDLLAGHLKLIHDAPQEVIPLFRRASEMRTRHPVHDRGENPDSFTGRSAAAGAFSCRPRPSTWPICCANFSGRKWMPRC